MNGAAPKPLLRGELPEEIERFIEFDTQFSQAKPGKLTATGIPVMEPRVWRKCSVCEQRYHNRVSTLRAEIKRKGFVTAMCNACSRKNNGINNNKGGFINQNGYRVVSPNGDGSQVLEHRYVMEQSLGRPLSPYEQVHHINGDRADNRLENLQLRATAHGAGIKQVCNACGSHDIQAIKL